MNWPCLVLLPFVLWSGVRATGPDLSGPWQGEWVVRDAVYPGSVQAWSVHGNSLVVYDPATHRRVSQQFRLQSPCRLIRTESIGNNTVVTTNSFAFALDGLHVGPPEAAGGARHGSLSMACVGDRVYVFDERNGDCKTLQADMRESATSSNDECALVHTPPGIVLRGLGAVGKDLSLTFAGNALLSPELTGAVSEKQPSFEAAMRRADILAPQHP